ncbi:hypothetical protein AX17_006667 [Amanita inopinata Kibby_2008]|nr:hypothetical protein AX17_006667 [Amanita inopinata Kibby_2008]
MSETDDRRVSLAESDANTFVAHSLQASSSNGTPHPNLESTHKEDSKSLGKVQRHDQDGHHEPREHVPNEKEIWPPHHPRRTLVLCFDGTGDQFDSDNSNIVELVTALKKDDASKQMVYYQAGIGTYAIPQIVTPLMSAIDKKIDDALAWHLDAHVMGGYEFLMQNYLNGDRICLFGFSRGAYVARALAGMIHKIGLLPPGNHQQVPFAYKMYTRTDAKGWSQSNAFKKAFSMDVDIEFVGVWDTVSSVGVIARHLPFATSNTSIRAFRHAVSLDERRAKYKANLWNRPSEKELNYSNFDADNPMNNFNSTEDSSKRIQDEEVGYLKDPAWPTDVKEVWFSGCHCDIGGGAVSNETIINLARIPLRWMIRECFRRKSGILFMKEGLQKLGLNPDVLWPTVQERPAALTPVETAFIAQATSESSKVVTPMSLVTSSSEEQLDLYDVMSPSYDRLLLSWGWWLLEFIPLIHHYQDPNTNQWKKGMRCNWGRGRVIRKGRKILVHRSVLTRMQAHYENGSKYEPKARFDLDDVEWVD